jgi:hypothetical protein
MQGQRCNTETIMWETTQHYAVHWMKVIKTLIIKRHIQWCCSKDSKSTRGLMWRQTPARAGCACIHSRQMYRRDMYDLFKKLFHRDWPRSAEISGRFRDWMALPGGTGCTVTLSSSSSTTTIIKKQAKTRFQSFRMSTYVAFPARRCKSAEKGPAMAGQTYTHENSES